MFRKNTAVFGGNFTVVNEEVNEGLNGRQILSQSHYVVHGAIHDSGQRYPPSECHPGTREDVLNIALGWVDKQLDESESQIFWLSGPAGVGKTAIAQSLCNRLKELGRLGGDFFLSRSVAGHSDLHTLFPTLAYQLAEVYPEFGHELDVVIKTNQSVLTKNIEIQLEELIMNPMKRATHNDSSARSLVLVIDGLDEGGGERGQTLLVQLLNSGFIGHRLPLKIILTSRPEPWIKSAFGANPLMKSTQRHFLHRTSQTDIDIRNVLEFGFANISKTHDLMKSRSEKWPSSEVIDNIVDRASGQFIYASTVLRYVEDPNGNPIERLRRVIEMPSKRFTDSPFLALDSLYKHVLSTSLNLDRTLIILGAVIASFRTPFIPPPPLVSSNAALGLCERPPPPLELDSSSASSRRSSINHQTIDEAFSLPIDRIERILDFQVADGLLALRTIQSLVDISSSTDRRVKFYHKSFQDFLLDPNRSAEYFIDISQVYSKLTIGTFRLLNDYGQSDTRSRQKPTYYDLQNIDLIWEEWWLCSAASDQDFLLTEVKAIDKTMFHLKYAMNIAQKIPFLFLKTYYIRSGRRARLQRCRSNGNIADLILREINRETTFGFSWERFRTAKAVFKKHLNQALEP